MSRNITTASFAKTVLAKAMLTKAEDRQDAARIYFSRGATRQVYSMTDDELKALVANLAVAQDRTDAQMAANAVQMAKTDAKLNRLAEMYGGVGNSQGAARDQIDAQLAANAAQMAKTDAKLDRLAEMYGGVGNSQGAVTEEFYYNSLKADPVLAGMRFDIIDKNVTRSHAGLEDEFDLILVNGREVFVVEVKYKAHKRDLERLLNKKAVNFRNLFPEHASRRQRFALAAFHIHDELKQAALGRGVTVLQRKGDVIETLAA